MFTLSPSPQRTSYNREIHHRRSVRLKGYDYSQPGAYFVTVCTWNKECLFGRIVDGEMHLNDYGKVVQEEWLRSAEIRREIMLDEWVIMPNHIHAIVVITDFRRGDRPVARTKDQSSRPTGPKPESLSSLMAGFKSAVTKRINIHRNTPRCPCLAS
jgi:REP element-mobilizing transposase RayT